MISQDFSVSAFDSRNEVEPMIRCNQNNNRIWNGNLLRPIPVSSEALGRARSAQSSFISSSDQGVDRFSKPSSMSHGFLAELSSHEDSFEEDSSLNSLSSHSYEEDTDSDFCSGEADEDELVNEMKSRNEAEDEVASLFESDNSAASEPLASSRPIFDRPHNPIVQDRRFFIPRCSAPSLEEQARPGLVYISKPRYCVYNSQFN